MLSKQDIPSNFHNIAGNSEFNEWCEKIGNDSFQESQNDIPVKIEKYFELRDIQKVEFSSKIVSHARLINKKSFFLIQLNNKLKSNKQVNYFIAHEIAHTFFYKKNRDTYIPADNIIYRSNDLEKACDRIACCLLLPKDPLLKELSNHPSIDDCNFSLKVINNLCNIFAVNHTLLIRRLSEDLGIWKNFMLLRFKFFKNGEINEWRIYERFDDLTIINDKKVFLPPPDKYKDRTDPGRYPKAKGNFLKFVKKYFDKLHNGEEESVTINCDNINGMPLTSFFNAFSGRTFKNAIVSKIGNKKDLFLNLLLRLDDKYVD